MANPILVTIQCDACGGDASVKKLNNSPLLYLHCKTCGMDRRSGKQLQAKWQAAIDGKSGLPDAPEQAESVEGEWSPPVEDKPESNAEDKPENSGISGKSVAVGTIGVLSVLAMFFKAVRG
ncbi:hypothetical protein Ssed_2194 [Shewanella sediminis HAW-EB3]|uniref:Uncharacterized protein n=1 Tax=Shewanella sediminis (strain HAW-EB3) TaxID=425104 RepID=A8FVD0_SHESH|nr:hypothetical protein [Shewanella sediminis]ABV36803.1 hypothetical protein Ssed_2194 [Shewanella sediminis HAW-EB3]